MVTAMREMLEAAKQDEVAKRPAGKRPAATGGGTAKRPAAADVLAPVAMGAPLKHPAAAGPARKEHAKPAAAGPARAKPARGTSKGLPMGWRTQVSIRKSGASAGVKDTYYWSPDGMMYRSYREAFGSARR